MERMERMRWRGGKGMGSRGAKGRRGRGAWSGLSVAGAGWPCVTVQKIVDVIGDDRHLIRFQGLWIQYQGILCAAYGDGRVADVQPVYGLLNRQA